MFICLFFWGGRRARRPFLTANKSMYSSYFWGFLNLKTSSDRVVLCRLVGSSFWQHDESQDEKLNASLLVTSAFLLLVARSSSAFLLGANR